MRAKSSFIARRRPVSRTSRTRSQVERAAWAAADRVLFEGLEHRQLFTLLPIGSPTIPEFNVDRPGAINYTTTTASATGNLDVTSTLVSISTDGVNTIPISAADQVQGGTTLDIVINKADGSLAGGISGYDVVLRGAVVLDGNTYSGILLKGEVLEFGFSSTGNSYNFRISNSGGLLSGTPYFSGSDIGFALNRLNASGFTAPTALPGGFSKNFGGAPKGVFWPITSTTGSGPTLTSLAGHVYVDANNNGVRDDGEAPIPGTTVQAVGVNADGTFTTTTVTDADGAYLFTNIPAGTYRINETQPANYLDGIDAVGTVNGTPAGTVLPPDSLDQVGLPVNGVGVDYDFGEIGSSISGYVYHDANNDGIFQSTESPIPGTTVTLTGKDFSGATVNLTATTDSNGFYSFTGLAPADSNGYTLTETQPAGYADGKDTIGTPGGTPANDQFSNIQLPVGYNGQNNNFGEILPSSISGFVYHDANNDGTFQNTESPIPNVPVVLTGTDDLGNAVSLATTTNALGYYEFTGLRPGTYQLNETQPANYLDGKDTVGTPGGATTNDQFSAINLPENYAGQNNNFGEVLPASLAGNVYYDANDNGIFESTESGISNATITLTGTDDLGNPISLTTTTSSTGAYYFGNLRPGTYQLAETQPAGYLDGKDTIGTPGGTTSNDNFSSIDLTSGAAGTDNNFGEVLPAQISGYVYYDADNDGTFDSTEAPIPGTTVTLAGLSDLGNAVTLTATTNSAGYYEFTGLRPGTYTVTETQPNGYLDGKDTQGTPGNGVTGNDVFSAITIASGTNGQNNNFGELLPASLGDRVWVDSNHNGVQDGGEAGLANVTVTLYDAAGNVLGTTSTDSTGIYGFNGLRPGTYSVGFTLPAGYLFTTKDAAAATDATDSDADTATGRTTSTTLAAGQADLTLDAGLYALTPAIDIEKYVNPEAAPVGGEGLTPGFWKQSQHFDQWFTYHTTDSYNAVFGVNDPDGNSLSLLDALARGGGANQALGRQAAAALLNAANPNVSYLYTAGQIIAIVRSAYATGNFDYAKNLLAQQNSLEADLSTPAVFTPAAPGYGYDADLPGTGPTVLPGTQLTFTFVVKNTGDTPLINVVVTDDNATPGDPSDDFAPTYVSGDTNNDHVLDLNETWVYTWVTSALAGSHTNTASVVGTNPYAPTQTVTDSDAANYATGSTPAPAAIGDRAWVDANKNGVQDNGEAGLANVTVNLLDASGNVLDTTTTDSAGHYAFTNLAPGNYKVQFATPAGYALTTKDAAAANDATDSDADSTGTTIVTTLSAGETDNTWDAGFYQLPVNNASISGTKFLDITGNGFSSDDTGLGGVTIQLYVDKDNSGTYTSGDTLYCSKVTAADGSYSFSNLPAGHYLVKEVVPAGYVRTGPASTDTYAVTVAAGDAKAGYNFDNAETCDLSDFCNVYYIINGCTKVTDLRGHTHQGDTVVAYFTYKGSEANHPVTLVSYDAPTASFDANNAYLQQIYQSKTILAQPGKSYSISVTIPDCYYQVDFVCGYAIDQFGPANSNIFYSAQSRLISADNGGTTACFCGTSSISGFVFSDLNNDGDIDSNEGGIKNVIVTLTGVNDLGQAVYATDTTDADGFYQFTGLRDGTYKVTETQPSAYQDGKDSLGSLGGTLGNDVFSNVTISGGNQAGIDYNFGEITTAPSGPSLGCDMTATIGFWQNKNGQKLITSLNGSANCTKLGTWLATNFPNLFGNTSGTACNLSGKTNTQVAAAFVTLFNVKGTKTEAQVMATALAVYATDSDLAGGTYAKTYGFVVNSNGTGAATFNVGSNGSAIGLVNNKSYTISQILTAANKVDAFDCSSTTQTAVNNLFSNINQTGDIS